jgi:hypothetical protein
MKSPYDSRTEEIRQRLFPRTSWSKEGLYVFINQQGYMHVLKPCRITYDGELSHYEIKDLLLQPDGTAKEVKCTGYYRTMEDCIAEIEKKLIIEQDVVL